jgi:hypothetical protein
MWLYVSAIASIIRAMLTYSKYLRLAAAVDIFGAWRDVGGLRDKFVVCLS